ncbi:sugar-transfer associated ATP-grasp domain-containing protein [Dongia deserti]|uniref:sugar-transfer associated ATP-grasp domain-containing protein n=1 Tax=Dongia deserti TaxID=2268030 RepID=UPI000E646814|nr:sugar-transfer associated ATP-grasp domain-containing protein [Dongia deserti]
MAQTRLPYCSPYRLFWAALGTPRSASDKIHAAYARFAWRSMGPKHVALTAALCVLWPVNFIVMLWMFTRRIAPAVARATGKPVWRQIVEQLWLAIRYSIPPDKYYVFDLFRPERLANARHYILRYELKGGFHNLVHFHTRVTMRRSTKEWLKDKQRFFHRCEKAGVASPIIYQVATADGTFAPERHTGEGLPPHDLFLKPAKGKGGRGCEKWVYRDGSYEGPAGQRLTETALRAHILTLVARRGRYLMQECLRNHPDLLRFGGGLTSLRITTCKTETGGFEVTNAVLKMSLAAGSSVDNFHQGGAVCRVDVATGEIGPAWDNWIKRPCVLHHQHPVTGAAIVGTRLPCWPETVAMVATAARLFPDRIMIGFDVAITDRGPVIIEGNVQQGSDMVQRTHDLPVGLQRLGELLAFQSSEALATRPPRAMRWYGPSDYWGPR